MQLVTRMYVHPNATLRSMLIGPRRCGVPTMFGSIGTDIGGDDIFALAFEWTTDYAPLPGTNDEQRARNEQRHSTDVALTFEQAASPIRSPLP